MKKVIFYSVLTLLLGLGVNSFAVSDIEISGELDLSFAVKNLPTRDQGVTAFDIPALKIDIEAPLREGNEIFLELESAEYRDGVSKRFDTQLKEAYLSLTSLLPANSELRYGLIPDFYIALQGENWDYSFWGPASNLPQIRYKYVTWSDLGIMYQSELPGEWGQWALSFTNGEGYQSAETGRRKQGQLLLALTKAAPFYTLLSYTYGSYDDYDSAFNKKTRLAANFSYEFGRGLLSLEYYATQDPADAILAGGIAGGVDVTALQATVVDGEGASLLGRLGLAEKADLFLRLDWLSPVKTEKAKNLKAISTGVSYDSSEDIRWVLAYEYTDYSEEFAVAVRDESQLVLATKASF